MGCCSKTDEDSTDFHGPLKSRSCTDIFCLVFLVAFVGGMGYVGFLGFMHGGDPYKLVYGEDSWGNTCNRKNENITDAIFSGRDLTGLKKTFYFNFFALMDDNLDTSVMCVLSCPTPATRLNTTADLISYSQTSGLKLCRYDLSVSLYSNDETAQVCPALFSTDVTKHAYGVGNHSSLLNRCVPDEIKQMATVGINDAARSLSAIMQCDDKNKDFLSILLADMKATWHEVLYLSAMSVGVALIVVILMRFFAAIIIWALVVGSALGAIGSTAFLWYRYFTFNDSTETLKKAQAKDWMIYASIVSGATAVLLLILLVMRKRIGLVVQLFREASRAIARMPLLLMQPIWTFIWLVLLVSVMGVVYTFAETSGVPVVDTNTGKVTHDPVEIIKYMKWYYLFGFLWIIQLVFACHQLVLAGAVASWYFAENKKKLGWPILASIRRLLCYHIGSAAFGAFIIALVQFLRIILAMITKRLRGRTSKVVDFILKCLACCLWCFEKVLKFLNKNAYIMVAIYGYNFCRAARRAFTLLVSNALRVAAINSVGTFVLLLAKLGVAAVPVIVGLKLLEERTELCFVWAPLTVIGVASLLIAHMFLSVYGMAIDTIFLCFCEDCERNDGVTKPYYMSKGLMEYVSNASQALTALKTKEKKAKKGTGAADEDKAVASPAATAGGQAKSGVQW